MIRSILLAWVSLVSTLCAQETLFIQTPAPTHNQDKTRVEVEALFSMTAPMGYLPIRVTVINQRKNDGSLELNTISSAYGNDGQGELDSSFSMDVAANSTSTQDFLVPLATEVHNRHSGYGSSSVEVSMTGSFGKNQGSLASNFAPSTPAILMSEVLYTPNSSSIDAFLSRGSRHYGSHSFAARFTPSLLPEDWRAYSGYDLMILTSDDWQKISSGAKSAILQWMRIGGALAIYKSNAAVSYNTLGIDVEDTTSTRPYYGYGRIELRPLPSSGLTLDPATVINHFHDDPHTAIESSVESIQEDYSSRWPLHLKFGSQSFDYGLFVVVLVIFGILVGPINLFVFAKSGKRHKLFITTPIISIATSLILILLILVRDGVGGRGMRVALMEVRPEAGENRAYVIQEQLTRTGVLFGSSMVLKEDMQISPAPIRGNAWARLTKGEGGDMRYSMQRTEDGLKLTGDWFQSRSEQAQVIRAVIPTRGRIELKSEAGPPVFVSTFDFPVNKIYYKDTSGNYWTASDLKAGQASKAVQINNTTYNDAVYAASQELAPRQRQQLESAANRSDCYVAMTGDAPGIDTFDAIRWVETQTIITGPIIR